MVGVSGVFFRAYVAVMTAPLAPARIALAEVLSHEMGLDITPMFMGAVDRVLAALYLKEFIVAPMHQHAASMEVGVIGENIGIALIDANERVFASGQLTPFRMMNFAQKLGEVARKAIRT